MKRLVLTVLVAMVPFLMMAQKNKRKNKNIAVAEQQLKVIKGVQVISDTEEKEALSPDVVKEEVLQMSKMIAFSPIWVESDEGILEIEDALSSAIANGWQVYSANTVSIGNALVYFYYLKR